MLVKMMDSAFGRSLKLVLTSEKSRTFKSSVFALQNLLSDATALPAYPVLKKNERYTCEVYVGQRRYNLLRNSFANFPYLEVFIYLNLQCMK